jgi:hypothetical protein
MMFQQEIHAIAPSPMVQAAVARDFSDRPWAMNHDITVKNTSSTNVYHP